MKKFNGLFLIIILIAFIPGCTTSGTTLTGAEKDSILAFTEPMTDNLMAGMNANDYANFSSDFDATMLDAMTEDQFSALKKDRDTKLGPYISRQVTSVILQGEYYLVVYNAVFEKDETVMVRVVFNITEPHLISGLWFNK